MSCLIVLYPKRLNLVTIYAKYNIRYKLVDLYSPVVIQNTVEIFVKLGFPKTKRASGIK